jgi:hypothetical protein
MEKYYDVICNDGVTYEVIAESIRVKDGYVYFLDSNGRTKRTMAESDTVDIKPGRRVYCTAAKVIGIGTGLYTTYWAKNGFCYLADRMCPSQNPIIKGIWRGTAKVAAFGVGAVTTKFTSDAVEETIQPVFDIGAGVVRILKNVKSAANDSIKEVFEENPSNGSDNVTTNN